MPPAPWPNRIASEDAPARIFPIVRNVSSLMRPGPALASPAMAKATKVKTTGAARRAGMLLICDLFRSMFPRANRQRPSKPVPLTRKNEKGVAPPTLSSIARSLVFEQLVCEKDQSTRLVEHCSQ